MKPVVIRNRLYFWLGLGVFVYFAVTGGIDWLLEGRPALLALAVVISPLCWIPSLQKYVFSEQSISKRFLLWRKVYRWDQIIQAGLTVESDGMFLRGPLLVLTFEGGTPKSGTMGLIHWKEQNKGKCLYVPCTDALRQMILARYGPLDFEPKKPEKREYTPPEPVYRGESPSLTLRHHEWYAVGGLMAVMTMILSMALLARPDEDPGPMWFVLSVCLFGVAGAFCAGTFWERLDEKGVLIHRPFSEKQYDWSQIREIGISAQPVRGGHRAYISVILPGGVTRGELPGSLSWQMKNWSGILQLSYTKSALRCVRYYYGEPDYDDWGKPPELL